MAALISDRRFHRGADPLTPDELLTLLKDTGAATNDPAGTTPNPRRVDAAAAVEAASPPFPATTHPGLAALSIVLLVSGGWVLRCRLRGLADGHRS